jgi:hypothetical protein
VTGERTFRYGSNETFRISAIEKKYPTTAHRTGTKHLCLFTACEEGYRVSLDSWYFLRNFVHFICLFERASPQHQTSSCTRVRFYQPFANISPTT